MFPSRQTLRTDPCWIASCRQATLGTVLVNSCLLCALALTQMSAPKPAPRPMTLEFRMPAPPVQTVQASPVQAEPLQAEPVQAEPVQAETVQTLPVPLAPVPKAPLIPAPITPRQVEPSRPAAKASAKKTLPAVPVPTPVQAASAAQPIQHSVMPTSERVSPAPITPQPAQPAAPAPTSTAQVLAALTEMVERHKNYPRAAQRAGYEGMVLVAVRVDKDGVITGWSLEESSAYPLLDRATEKIFERLHGQKISAVQLSEGLRILVPVKYELRRG